MTGSRHTARVVGIVAIIAAIVLPALAQSRSERARAIQKLLPTPGKVAIEGSYPGSLENVGEEDRSKFEITEVEGRDFARITQVQVLKALPDIWQVQIHTKPNTSAVKTGDVLLYAFDARMLESKKEGGEGWIYSQLQRNSEPWDSFGGYEWSVTKEWRTFYLPVTADKDWKESTFTLGLHLAKYEQKLEIGGLIVINLGPGVDVSKLPQ